MCIAQRTHFRNTHVLTSDHRHTQSHNSLSLDHQPTRTDTRREVKVEVRRLAWPSLARDGLGSSVATCGSARAGTTRWLVSSSPQPFSNFFTHALLSYLWRGTERAFPFEHNLPATLCRSHLPRTTQSWSSRRRAPTSPPLRLTARTSPRTRRTVPTHSE